MQIITPTLLVLLTVARKGRTVSVDVDAFSKASLDFIVVGAGTAGTALAVRCIPPGYLAFNTWGDPEYDWSTYALPKSVNQVVAVKLQYHGAEEPRRWLRVYSAAEPPPINIFAPALIATI
ncbi:hypothetical protein EXIGLDRAFT_700536 [Exidia glandulosa HHB12029]|uniref:Glucose-methanol-choline oxidoreductase N-terminal domain-containing protein n=1 Tax=Exidia glandulosa HHB12029 TaxID=1314781 RepID=A0A165DE13_EXIGL|nr:hypothetical protein EXIGLDRAFT_700536 [Exidia glandulosa HHB12029]